MSKRPRLIDHDALSHLKGQLILYYSSKGAVFFMRDQKLDAPTEQPKKRVDGWLTVGIDLLHTSTCGGPSFMVRTDGMGFKWCDPYSDYVLHRRPSRVIMDRAAWLVNAKHAQDQHNMQVGEASEKLLKDLFPLGVDDLIQDYLFRRWVKEFERLLEPPPTEQPRKRPASDPHIATSFGSVRFAGPG